MLPWPLYNSKEREKEKGKSRQEGREGGMKRGVERGRGGSGVSEVRGEGSEGCEGWGVRGGV